MPKEVTNSNPEDPLHMIPLIMVQ